MVCDLRLFHSTAILHLQRARIFVDNCVSLAIAGRAAEAGAAFAPFLSDYRSLSVLIGKRISFLHGAKPVRGKVVDHGADGALLVLPDGDSAPVTFLSGEITGLELDSGETISGSIIP